MALRMPHAGVRRATALAAVAAPHRDGAEYLPP
eukprot:CAMPEP_0202088118 /NCGR_PEP_ID=MMETSP0964-20121228/37881_1 /ASSEMBLY_ACC=CAM_ASM_000500 /TAXON_ID=4773 /ORGANISM="Schizochytrium aggregatum, Strain ATCC28209" /LENGTH=32 /DNA_ID= /DNA_START= /DNA_END= /DNA_ORIENTATION=